MACRISSATAFSAIAIMFGMIAIANAAPQEGPRWPSIYAHFENHVVGGNASPQPVDWKVESYGVFVQGSFKFGPYPIGGYF